MGHLPTAQVCKNEKAGWLMLFNLPRRPPDLGAHCPAPGLGTTDPTRVAAGIPVDRGSRQGGRPQILESSRLEIPVSLQT